VRTLRSGLLSVLTLGSSLVCLGGLSGCDSRPADGTVVEDSRGTISDEEKSKVESHYMEKRKSAQKSKHPTSKRR
jgi:hypothetical protein